MFSNFGVFYVKTYQNCNNFHKGMQKVRLRAHPETHFGRKIQKALARAAARAQPSVFSISPAAKTEESIGMLTGLSVPEMSVRSSP